MINQRTLRSVLPGKIARTVMIMAEHTRQDPMAMLKKFYASSLYAQLEREETKLWWLSPEHLAREVSNEFC